MLLQFMVAVYAKFSCIVHVLCFSRRGFPLVVAQRHRVLRSSGEWLSTFASQWHTQQTQVLYGSSFILQGGSFILQQLPCPWSVSWALVHFPLQLAWVRCSCLLSAFAKTIVLYFFIHTKCCDRSWNHAGYPSC